MIYLISGLVIFFAAHGYSAFRARDPERDIKARMGEGAYMGAYSLVSLLGFGLALYGYGQAPYGDFLFAPPDWARSATAIAMLPALILIVSAYMPRGYIKALARHPMLLAVLIWSATHIAVGVTPKELLLFGAFGLYALIDLIAVARRPAIVGQASPRIRNDLIVIAVGTAAYFVLVLWAHEALIGVAPM